MYLETNWVFLLFLFLFGLAVGSFLNVVILRYEPSQPFFGWRRWLGRSHCPSCKTNLAWTNLVPLVSYLLQKGKCRSCDEPISIQYPLVELATGLLFVFVPLQLWNMLSAVVFGSHAWIIVLVSVLWIAVFLLFIVVTVIDLRYFLIPNSVNAALAVLGVAWTIVVWSAGITPAMGGGSFLGHFSGLFPVFGMAWENHLAGLAIGLIFFLVIVLVSLGKGMGMGDVKLIAALGLLFGWPDIAAIMALSFIIGGIFAAGYLLVGKKKMSDQLPFGPFIILAATILFFWGAGLAGAYLGIL